MPSPPTITPDELVDRYEVFLLDSYGVLVDASGALPGAAAFLDRLTARGREAHVLTNDASRSEVTWAERLARFGVGFRASRIVTAGSLLEPYFAANGLRGARCIVLGTEDSASYVSAAGGQAIDPEDETRPLAAVIVCDDAGYPFLETIEATVSRLYRELDQGRRPKLLLPNPDLVYPKDARHWGITSGSVALVIEAALARRHPEAQLRFVPLGKPHAPIFEEGLRRAAGRRAVMIGDQLETDIAGALAVGLDAVLVDTGIGRWREGTSVRPTWILPGGLR